MINKVCFVLIVAMCPATLFAGETMATRTTQRMTTGCDFRVDKCETSVATDPAYVRFKDGTTGIAVDTNWSSADPTRYKSDFTFVDYASTSEESVDELIALIRSKLSNCPEVTMSYDENSGDITVHYLKATCDCDCDWVVNVRNVKASDFVWKRTSDNYSTYLGQMERRKFHTTSEENAQKIESACAQICRINSWTRL